MSQPDFDVVACSYCGGAGSNEHGYCRQCGGTGAMQQQRQEEASRCIACDELLKVGELVLPDESGGLIHASCCGPERVSYTNGNGDPLGPDDPIPTGWAWEGEK
jgi:hypothetical protein